MLTRSLSYYTLSKQQSHSQLDLLSSDPSVPAPSASIAQPSGMPRSISLQKLSYMAGASASPSSTHSTPFGKNVSFAHSHGLAAYPIASRGRASTSTTTLELLEDSHDTPPSPSTLHLTTPMAAKTNEVPIPQTRAGKASAATPSDSASPPMTFALPPASTSPDGFITTTQAGSLPASITFPAAAPAVGNAILHTPGELGNVHGLPNALLEDFEIVGRANGGSDGEATSTCEAWIVRSKCSGKMAVFKPRDGEVFSQRLAYEAEQQAKREREERLRRLAARSGAAPTRALDVAALSSSCPTPPLALPTTLRTPIKRGVVYGETTRKEVAAYLLDHEHFAGVPRTVEATIWLQQRDAPHGGQNIGPDGVYNQHPYLHAHPALMPGSGNGSAAAASSNLPQLKAPSPNLGPATTPELLPQGSPRLLLPSSASTSPPLGPHTDSPLFEFEQESWMTPAAATGSIDSASVSASASASAAADQSSERSLFGVRSGAGVCSEEDTFSAKMRYIPPAARANASHLTHNTNLHPPSLLAVPASKFGGSAVPAASPIVTSPATSSPEIGSQAGSTPPEFRGLGLPASTGELIATYGSLQEFVENAGSAEDMGSNVFAADEVHRIGILDVRLLNLDRHLGNLLVSRDSGGQPHLVPIDHSYCLPSYHELSDVHLEWTYWRQCTEPFSKETLRYIARLDPIADAAKLRALGIRDEALVSMVFSSLLLKQAASEGLNLFHIAQMCQRDGEGEDPSTLEAIVQRVLGAQHIVTDSPEPPQDAAREEHLPVVEEESPTHASAPPSASASPAPSLSSEGSAAAAAATVNASPMRPLLTRSNSDGAVALAEALSGRQFSAPAAPASHEAEPPKRAAPVGRRPSVADAAKHLMAQLVDGSMPSPLLSATAAPSTAPPSIAPYSSPEAFQVQELPTPPPPPTLRLGTELTLHDPSHNGNAENLPSGAKLQHLLDLTQEAIHMELSSYRARHGLLPSPVAAPAPSPASAASASSPSSSDAKECNLAASPNSYQRASNASTAAAQHQRHAQQEIAQES